MAKQVTIAEEIERFTGEPVPADTLPIKKERPREIRVAIDNMTKRRLKLIAKRDVIDAEIAELDQSLLPWLE